MYSLAHALAFSGIDMAPTILGIADIFRIAIWILFLGVVLVRANHPLTIRALLLGGCAGCVVLFAITLSPEFADALYRIKLIKVDATKIYLGLALITLLLVEQVYRNLRESQKSALRGLGIGLGLPAAFDLCVSANFILFGEPNNFFEVLRGFVFAASAPLLAVGFKRIVAWDIGIFVSRQIVFYTASVTAAGIYLVCMAIAGYSIRSLNLPWGSTLQSVFFVAAIGILLWLLFSDSVRSAAIVWIQKNFYENKYDYRREWLRLSKTLTADRDNRSLEHRCVAALAQLIGAESGALWTLDRDGQAYIREFSLGKVLRAEEMPIDHPLIEFIEARRWVLDMREASRRPDHFESVEHVLGRHPFSPASLLVPLQHENDLLGLIEIDQQDGDGRLNYEDHDLLKTAGQQIASYLAQRNMARLLAESRQFEAFNKFSAFMMHDLKNLLAQLSLVVQNADKHRHNPEFVDDVFQTISNSVERTQGLLAQISMRRSSGNKRRVSLYQVLKEAVTRASRRLPVPVLDDDYKECEVLADAGRLLSIFEHIIRNAQEATPSDGRVRVHVTQSGNSVEVSVCDTGHGMTSQFVRDELFQPFSSTKGSQGMGIGAYQAREYIRELGGVVEVITRPERGTRFTCRLPTA